MKAIYSSRFRPILHFGVALGAVSPIAAVFYWELAALPKTARVFTAGCAIAAFALALQLMTRHVRQLAPSKLAFLAVITLAGVCLYVSTGIVPSLGNLANWEQFLGKLQLFAFAFFAPGLLAVLSLKRSPDVHIAAPVQSRIRRAIPYLVVSALVILITYWSISRTVFVYFWDYRNYWEKTEGLYGLLNSGEWRHAVAQFVRAYSADYSLLPAVLPATLALFAGYPTRLEYALTLTCIYAVPAYVAVTWLGKRLLERAGRGPYDKGGSTWVYASVPVFFGLPVFFATSLNLMPDIGGVVLFVAALAFAASMVREIAAQPDQGDFRITSLELLKSSVGLGLMFSLMFLFRRWYVFAAVGIASSCAMLVLAHFWQGRRHIGALIQRALIAVAFVLFASLPFLCWVLFSWSQDMGSHDYSSLYASWQASASAEWRMFSLVIGLAAMSQVAAFLLLFRWIKPNKHLLFILFVSSIVASLLFLQIQGPGKHHYYLLMPLFGASLAALSLTMYRSFGLVAPAALSAVLIVGSATSTWKEQPPTWLTKSFPAFSEWLPKKQLHQKGYTEVVAWLLLPENRQKRFCLIASSASINQSVFKELWQLLPSLKKGAFDDRFVLLGSVDSKAGPPSKDIYQCQIALVGVPFQGGLEGQQYTMQLVKEDLVGRTGIGGAFAPSPKEFNMDGGIKLLAFERTRGITAAEYANLVERFIRVKGPGYTPPPR